LTDALNAILTRRIMRVGQSGVKGWPDDSPRFARLDDITSFIERRTNDALLADLIWGLSLLDWQRIKPLAARISRCAGCDPFIVLRHVAALLSPL
jgi:CRISPR-associated protein Csx17